MKTHGDATSAVLFGLESFRVEVHAEAYGAQPAGIRIVGLSDVAEREARVRVRSALATVGATLENGVTVTVGEIPHGCSTSGLDLPIAVAVLRALGKAPTREEAVILGELALDGTVRPVRGVLVHLRWARERGVGRAIVPLGNEHEASLEGAIHTQGAVSLEHVGRILRGEAQGVVERREVRPTPCPDLSDVAEPKVRRALEIAAAGGHGILLVGPPGSGKTRAARRLPGILPELTNTEARTVTAIQSAAGLLPSGAGLVTARPFRAPHHTVSEAGLLGGGQGIRPGEASLAHHGVLFLDELAEFRALPLATLGGAVKARRLEFTWRTWRATLPCESLLVGAANPCPCGYLGERGTRAGGRCQCGEARVESYRSRFDGWARAHLPIRVELRAWMPGTGSVAPGESSATVRERVTAARARQYHRNDRLNEHGDHDAVYRVARTIADLDLATAVEARHMEEAMSFVEPKS